MPPEMKRLVPLMSRESCTWSTYCAKNLFCGSDLVDVYLVIQFHAHGSLVREELDGRLREDFGHR